MGERGLGIAVLAPDHTVESRVTAGLAIAGRRSMLDAGRDVPSGGSAHRPRRAGCDAGALAAPGTGIEPVRGSLDVDLGIDEDHRTECDPGPEDGVDEDAEQARRAETGAPPEVDERERLAREAMRERGREADARPLEKRRDAPIEDVLDQVVDRVRVGCGVLADAFGDAPPERAATVADDDRGACPRVSRPDPEIGSRHPIVVRGARRADQVEADRRDRLGDARRDRGRVHRASGSRVAGPRQGDRRDALLGAPFPNSVQTSSTDC